MVDMYSLLFDCCEKYYDSIAWVFPEVCPDGYPCCGLDHTKFDTALKFEIPTLFRNETGVISKPRTVKMWDGEVHENKYDQYALLDLIELICQNCKDYKIVEFHKFFGHNHLSHSETRNVVSEFRKEINNIFEKTGLLFVLTSSGIIERIIENNIISTEIESVVNVVAEKGTRELLKEALALFRQPNPASRKLAVDKIWDALERLKTFYTTMDKKNSSNKIINDMASGNPKYIELFTAEFLLLTDIGNKFRIRHHETDKIDITDDKHYDYFFNRCLSLISLATQYLNRQN